MIIIVCADCIIEDIGFNSFEKQLSHWELYDNVLKCDYVQIYLACFCITIFLFSLYVTLNLFIYLFFYLFSECLIDFWF